MTDKINQLKAEDMKAADDKVRKRISQDVDKCMKEVGEKAFMIKKSIDRLKNSNMEFENGKDENGQSNKVGLHVARIRRTQFALPSLSLFRDNDRQLLSPTFTPRSRFEASVFP